MVSPRLQSADEISGAVDRTDAKLDGQFQRARLRAYDQLTGLATILVYLRRGQTAELSDVQTLGDDTDVLAWVGYDVLIAAPSGRIFDGGYVLGLANGVGLLYDSLNLRATGSETARDFALAPSVDGWTTSISPSEPAGALTVTSIEARLDSVSSTTPVIRLAAGGVTADYRAEQLPPSAFTVHPDVLALPIAVFRPAIEPFRMETAGGFHIDGPSGRLRRHRGPLAGRYVYRCARTGLSPCGVLSAPSHADTRAAGRAGPLGSTRDFKARRPK